MQDSAEYDDSEEYNDDILIISAGKESRKKLIHVDATVAIDVHIILVYIIFRF